MLSGRGLCDELITHPEESYRMWCVVVCDLEATLMRRQWPALGCSTTGVGMIVYFVRVGAVGTAPFWPLCKVIMYI